MAKKVSLSDVASAAGVSLATASRALGSAGRISEATRARVLETASRLDFQPDALARSFVTGRSATVGVIAEKGIGLYSMPVVIGASERFGQHGIATLMHNAHATTREMVVHLKQLKARRVDALLVVGDTPDLTDLAEAIQFPSPIVFANVEPSPHRPYVVVPDDRHSGLMVGRHLVALGRRRIAHITAAADYPAVRNRAAGLFDALAEGGLDLVGGAPLHGAYSRAWGRSATEKLLATRLAEPFDAIFAGDDEIALGAYAALTEAGLSVPDDVAIAGHDHQQQHVQHDEVWLTSVRPHLLEVGHVAADAVLAAIDGREPEPVTMVPGELFVGRSTIGPTLGRYDEST